MYDFNKIKLVLSRVDASSFDDVLEDCIIDELREKADTLSGQLLGLGVEDVEVFNDSIAARVGFIMVGDHQLDEDGENQDEDGNSFDIPESQHFFSIDLTEKGIAWESE